MEAKLSRLLNNFMVSFVELVLVMVISNSCLGLFTNEVFSVISISSICLKMIPLDPDKLCILIIIS